MKFIYITKAKICKMVPKGKRIYRDRSLDLP